MLGLGSRPISLSDWNCDPENFEATWGGVAAAANKAALREKHLTSSAARRQGWEQFQHVPHEPGKRKAVFQAPDHSPIALTPV
jgi:hypothetical protein